MTRIKMERKISPLQVEGFFLQPLIVLSCLFLFFLVTHLAPVCPVSEPESEPGVQSEQQTARGRAGAAGGRAREKLDLGRLPLSVSSQHAHTLSISLSLCLTFSPEKRANLIKNCGAEKSYYLREIIQWGIF